MGQESRHVSGSLRPKSGVCWSWVTLRLPSSPRGCWQSSVPHRGMGCRLHVSLSLGQRSDSAPCPVASHGDLHQSVQAKSAADRVTVFWNLIIEVTSSVDKESACNAGDPGLIPGLGRSPGEGNGNPLQSSCLEKSHGQRSLVGSQFMMLQELDMTCD